MLPTFMQEPHLTGLVRLCPVNRRYVHPRFFPFEDASSDEFLSWIELDQNPMAPFVSVDGETPALSGDIYSKIHYSVAYIRYKRQFKQSDLRIFEEVARSQNSEVARMQMDKRNQILKATRRLSESLDARLEWLCINALAGSVQHASGGIRFTVSYPGPFTGDNMRDLSTYWDQTDATPVADLLQWIESVGEKCGTDPSVLVCSRKVIRELADNAAIRDLWFTGQAGLTSGALPPNFVVQALKMAGIDDVIIYDAKYTTVSYDSSTGAPDLTQNRFLAKKYAFLLPNKPIGRLRTAPGPDGQTTGKFTWTKDSVDPWIVQVGAGIYAFPEIVDLNTWAYAQVLSS